MSRELARNYDKRWCEDCGSPVWIHHDCDSVSIMCEDCSMESTEDDRDRDLVDRILPWIIAGVLTGVLWGMIIYVLGGAL